MDTPDSKLTKVADWSDFALICVFVFSVTKNYSRQQIEQFMAFWNAHQIFGVLMLNLWKGNAIMSFLGKPIAMSGLERHHLGYSPA